jgi:hypothetical protein
MSQPLPLKLARPREIQLLKMAGYEVVGPWDESFTLMQLPRETKFDLDADAEALAAAVADLGTEQVPG